MSTYICILYLYIFCVYDKNQIIDRLQMLCVAYLDLGLWKYHAARYRESSGRVVLLGRGIPVISPLPPREYQTSTVLTPVWVVTVHIATTVVSRAG